MPLSLTILASSSEANCAIVRSAETTIMLDCGIPRAKCFRALAEAGISADDVSAVVVTHGHSDHVGGLEGFAGRLNIPVYCSWGEADFLTASGYSLPLKRFRVHPINDNGFLIGNIVVLPFDVPHASAAPVGYRFASDDRAISFATDLGWIPEDVEQELLASDLLFLESNFCPDMLAACSYPKATKMRTASGAGHLSNEQCCELLAKIDSRPSTVILGHVSQTANDEELVRLMAQQALAGKAVSLHLATEILGKEIQV